VDDSTLAQHAADGDDAAFELLVRRHTEAAWRLARSLLGDDFEAEDAVQDSLVKAYRSMASFRGEAAFRTWLLAICHRTCLDRLRLKERNIIVLTPLVQAQEEEDHADLRVALAHLVNQLPTDEREAFVVVHVLGCTRDEAAKICGVPASTMRARVIRARQRLAAAIVEAEAQEGGA
jgi:RNA polymerase sigma-70 factor, ECF subfamily